VSDYFSFWIMRGVADFAIAIGLTLMALVVLFLACVPSMFREWRCKHDGGVRETSACDAICRKCGKNLGFIGNVAKELAK